MQRYLIYRRLQSSATFDDALAELPSGQATYTYDDPTVLWDCTYVYGVTALDCRRWNRPSTARTRFTSSHDLLQRSEPDA